MGGWVSTNYLLGTFKLLLKRYVLMGVRGDIKLLLFRPYRKRLHLGPFFSFCYLPERFLLLDPFDVELVGVDDAHR